MDAFIIVGSALLLAISVLFFKQCHIYFKAVARAVFPDPAKDEPEDRWAEWRGVLVQIGVTVLPKDQRDRVLLEERLLGVFTYVVGPVSLYCVWSKAPDLLTRLAYPGVWRFVTPANAAPTSAQEALAPYLPIFLGIVIVTTGLCMVLAMVVSLTAPPTRQFASLRKSADALAKLFAGLFAGLGLAMAKLL